MPRMRDVLGQALSELRFEPTERRIRAELGGEVAARSDRAVLVWEPRRIVPSYAMPEADVTAELVPATAVAQDGPGPPLLHPGIPFAVHTSPGEPLAVRAGGEVRDQAAFRLAGEELAGHVVLDFFAFDAWFEEDERIVGHPRDPFHRVDARRSSRHVRVELDGQVLAETTRPTLVFETNLPVRFYLPREDVRVALRPATRRTTCAYKGHASYWALDAGGRERDDLLWSYEDPLPDARALEGLVAFFDEQVDVVLDGQRRPRPHTVFSADDASG